MWFLKELFRITLTALVFVFLFYFITFYTTGCALVEKHSENFKEDAKLEAAKLILDVEKTEQEMKSRFNNLNDTFLTKCPAQLTKLQCEEYRRSIDR